MSVGTLEEMIDDNHAIVTSSMGPEYYVTIMSFVNQDLLEPGCSVLLHNKVEILSLDSFAPYVYTYDRRLYVQVMSVVGILADDADPLVSVMKVEKAPLESYADIGGLYEQVKNLELQI